MSKRSQERAGRDAGHSVVHIRTGGWGWRVAPPHRLNGPVIITQKGKPTKTLWEVDPCRYASKCMRRKVLVRDNYKCRYCDCSVTGKEANIDHVKPWRDGGRTSFDNLVTCCRNCNKAKGNNPRWRYRGRATPLGIIG